MSESNSPINTPPARVFKNEHRIKEIRCLMQADVIFSPTAWEVSRLVRRDFNLVTSKMLIASSSKNPARRDEIREAVDEVRVQAELLSGEAKKFAMSHEIPVLDILELTVVSPDAAQLLRSFTISDGAMARLMCAVLDGKMSKDERGDLFEEFTKSYYDLKALVLGTRKSQKSASELGQELGME